MRKGIFFTMDAVIAFYLALILLSTFLFLMESSQNYSEDFLSLQRLSRDVYEIQQYDDEISLPEFLSDDCGEAYSVGSALIFTYEDIELGGWPQKSEILTYSSEVCIRG